MTEKETRRKITLLESKKEVLFARVQQLYDLSLKVSDPTNENLFMSRFQSLDKTRTDFL